MIDEEGQIILEFEPSFDNETSHTEIPIDVSNGYVLTRNDDYYYAIYDFEWKLNL